MTSLREDAQAILSQSSICESLSRTEIHCLVYIASKIHVKITMPPESSDLEKSDDDVAYTDEPLADAEWIKNYQEEMKANEELERSLKDRLQGNVELKEW